MRINVACVTDATKLLVKSVGERALKSLFKAPTCVYYMHHDLNTRHDQPVKKAVVDLPNQNVQQPSASKVTHWARFRVLQKF